MLERMIIALFASLALACSIASAATTPLPNDDPFYTPPAGFENAPPGTVFKNRTIPSPAAGVFGVQLLYRTSGTQIANATVTVATVLYNWYYNRGQLVAFQYPEDSDYIGCAPSYEFKSGNGGVMTSLVQSGLNKGWPIIFPDYEGLGSNAAAGVLGGYQVLDAFRAALSFKPLGFSPKTNLGGYGYSGGAIGSGWAAQLQKSYAPELNVVGWGFGGTPANLTSVVYSVANGSFAGHGFAGLFGLLSAYPTTTGLYAKYATDAGKAAIRKMSTQCLEQNVLSYQGQSVLSYDFCTIGYDFLKLPEVASVLKMNTMGLDSSEVPIAPVFMYHSSTDAIASFPEALKTFKAWCAYGPAETTNMQFVTVKGNAGHGSLGFQYIPTLERWLNDRLIGLPLSKKGCFQTSDVVIGVPGAQPEVERY